MGFTNISWFSMRLYTIILQVVQSEVKFSYHITMLNIKGLIIALSTKWY